jgi:hypothetical protein
MPHKGYTWTDEYKAEYLARPLVQAHMEDFLMKARMPKSDTQRQKMSEAKLGRKYTQEHKDNMSEAQKFRHALFRKVQADNPDLDSKEIWVIVRREMYDLPTN